MPLTRQALDKAPMRKGSAIILLDTEGYAIPPWRGWRGGRHRSSHGYITVNVPASHHLAVSGKAVAYEHRLVMERKLGRRLQTGEEVHHVNGDKGDNRPENLELMGNRAEHVLRHRKRRELRVPGEENPTISCICGCGVTGLKYDESGRPRRWLCHRRRKSGVV
jgi:HNH endonuclease